MGRQATSRNIWSRCLITERSLKDLDSKDAGAGVETGQEDKSQRSVPSSKLGPAWTGYRSITRWLRSRASRRITTVVIRLLIVLGMRWLWLWTTGEE